MSSFGPNEKNPKNHRHKLAPIAKGPYLVTKTDKNTVVIERSNRSVEKVSRSRVVFAPKQKMKEEVHKALTPEQLPIDGNLKTESTNLEDVSRMVAATKQTNDATEDHRTKTDAASQKQN